MPCMNMWISILWLWLKLYEIIFCEIIHSSINGILLNILSMDEIWMKSSNYKTIDHFGRVKVCDDFF